RWEGRGEVRVDILAIVQGRRQRDLLREQRIAHLQGEIFAQWNAELESAAVGFRAVRKIDVGERLPGKQIHAAGNALVEKIRLDEAQLGGANILAIGDRRLGEAP